MCHEYINSIDPKCSNFSINKKKVLIKVLRRNKIAKKIMQFRMGKK